MYTSHMIAHWTGRPDLPDHLLPDHLLLRGDHCRGKFQKVIFQQTDGEKQVLTTKNIGDIWEYSVNIQYS